MEQKQSISQEIKKLISKANGILNESEKKQQTIAYLYIIFSLIALSFFGLFAISPTITTISNLNKQFNEETLALEKLQAKNKALTDLSISYGSIQSLLPLIDNAIPQSPTTSRSARQIEVLSVKSKVNLEGFEHGLLEVFPLKSNTNSVFSFNFSVSVTGSENNVNSFVRELINMERIIGIENLTIGQEGTEFAAFITAKAFFYNN